ncbi:C2 domain-containing protein 2 [Sciurus carolinensis]|uniref:C2 domain-containing protein 2 n=1 Tax=Sciurus carolinensis TaxID=30640 RepID=A0AA41MMR1_SCICA|nr:C2 domain-containing protein 2 [Sciurus carolinensis]
MGLFEAGEGIRDPPLFNLQLEEVASKELPVLKKCRFPLRLWEMLKLGHMSSISIQISGWYGIAHAECLRYITSLSSPRPHALDHNAALMQKYASSMGNTSQDALSGLCSREATVLSVPPVEDESVWVPSALETQENKLNPKELEKHPLATACGGLTLLELNGDELSESSLSISQHGFVKKLQEEF